LKNTSSPDRLIGNIILGKAPHQRCRAFLVVNLHFSPGGVAHSQSNGSLEKNEDVGKYTVLFKQGYHGSGWSLFAQSRRVRRAHQNGPPN
jgi:hypothetical protein